MQVHRHHPLVNWWSQKFEGTWYIREQLQCWTANICRWAGQSNSAVCKGAGLSGSIPKELSNCKKLTLINLSFNAFTGSIPEELADLEAIATFFVEGLSGHIPDWIRNRASVRSISLAENMFSGPLPVLPLQHSLQKPTSSQVLSQPRYVKPTLCSHSYCTITIWLGVL